MQQYVSLLTTLKHVGKKMNQDPKRVSYFAVLLDNSRIQTCVHFSLSISL